MVLHIDGPPVNNNRRNSWSTFTSTTVKSRTDISHYKVELEVHLIHRACGGSIEIVVTIGQLFPP